MPSRCSGLNILTGFNGQISLGHGAFYAIGAYTTAILLDRTGIPYWAAIPIAGAVCLVVGFLFGLPALRLEGHLSRALHLRARHRDAAAPEIHAAVEKWTGGVQGTFVPTFAAPFGLPLAWDQWLYLLSLAIAAVMFLLAWNLAARRHRHRHRRDPRPSDRGSEHGHQHRRSTNR